MDRYLCREMDYNERYIIALDKNYNVLFDDIFDENNILINECAYKVGSIILPYFENKIISVPGIYKTDGNDNYQIVYPDDENRSYYHYSRAKRIDENNILDVMNELGNKSSYEMFSNITGEEYYVPEHPDDQPLRLAFKRVLNNKKVNLDVYKNKFTASAFNNFKRRANEKGLSIKMFTEWVEKFNLGATITCTDLDDPDAEPVTIRIN